VRVARNPEIGLPIMVSSNSSEKVPKSEPTCPRWGRRERPSAHVSHRAELTASGTRGGFLFLRGTRAGVETVPTRSVPCNGTWRRSVVATAALGRPAALFRILDLMFVPRF